MLDIKQKSFTISNRFQAKEIDKIINLVKIPRNQLQSRNINSCGANYARATTNTADVISPMKHYYPLSNRKSLINIKSKRLLVTILSIIILSLYSTTSPGACYKKYDQSLPRFKRNPITNLLSTLSSSLKSNDKIIQIFPQQALVTNDVRVLIDEGYHNSTEKLSSAINRLVQKYPNLAESFIVGESVKKQPILGLKISTTLKKSHESTGDEVPVEATQAKPGFVYLGGIHGDHALGHELSLHLGAFLLEKFSEQQDKRVIKLLENTDLFIIPSLNPDGFYTAREGDCYSARLKTGRLNAANIDLDQDFKFHNHRNIKSVLAQNELQPETKSFVNWLVTSGKSARMLASLRTGYTGITYPYDEVFGQITEHTYLDSGHSTQSNPAQDRLFFEYLGNQVFYGHQVNPVDSKCNPLANNVTVMDGSQLGSTYGTLSDFLYRFTDIFPVNIYLDCCKFPRKSELEIKWKQHANSMFAMIESINLGVRGSIVDIKTRKPISNAHIVTSGISHNVSSFDSGFYWRPLPPGIEFNLYVEADGYQSFSTGKLVSPAPDSQSNQVQPYYVNFNLAPTGDPSIHSFSVDGDGRSTTESHGDSTVKKQLSEPLEDLPSTSSLKPSVLFEHVDDQIANLDFKTPTNLKKHHNFSEMEDILRSLHDKYPKLTRLYSIGKSVEDRDLWVLEISNQPGTHQMLKPEFRYIGNMHGNEVVGRELLLHLAKLLLENYGQDDLITSLVNSTRIHILPSMNPDGYERSREGDCESETGRPNANDKDLNRNFPDRFGQNEDNKDTQPEVAAIMKWSKDYPFVLGANLHGGSLVANYPMDGNREQQSGQYERSSDDELFKHLARTYSKNHKTMYRGEHCYDICGDDKRSLLNERFPDGITNGAKWYVLYGGIQDWVYLNTNCFTITVELGCRKFPYAKDMPRYWADNKKALIKYMLEVHKGIYGVVTDQNDRPIGNATVHIKGINHDVRSVDTGDYWRILLPGEYFVTVSKENYRAAHRNVTVGKFGPALRVDFSLINGPKDLSLDIASGLSIVDSQSQAINDPQAPSVHSYSLSDEPLTNETSNGSGRSNSTSSKMIHGNRNSTTGKPTHPLPERQDSQYMAALCFVIVLPTILLFIYLFGLTDTKRYQSKFGFSRLATNSGQEDLDGDDEELTNEGTRFMKRATKFTRLDNQASDSEDELYSADDWNK